MTEQFSEFPLDLPAHYRIYVTGVLDSSWVERYWGMTSCLAEPKDGPVQTMLVGEVADQAALAGILAALYNMQHTIVSVERMLSDIDAHPDDTVEEA